MQAVTLATQRLSWGNRNRKKYLYVGQFWEVFVYTFHAATQRFSLEKKKRVKKAQTDKLPTVPAQVLLLIALPGVEGFY